MSFLSKLGKIGKVALKVAPYAAMAIPGVGVPLGMAMAGGISAADKKVSGGSWKDALLSGGMSAGLSAVGAGALKGIGPSSGTMAKILGGAGGVEGLGVKGAIGKTLGNMGINAANARLGNGGPQSAQMPSGETFGGQPSIGPSNPNVMTMSQPQQSYNQPPPSQQSGLADSIFSGRQRARQRMAFA